MLQNVMGKHFRRNSTTNPATDSRCVRQWARGTTPRELRYTEFKSKYLSKSVASPSVHGSAACEHSSVRFSGGHYRHRVVGQTLN